MFKTWINIFINGNRLKQRDLLKIKSSDERNNTEIASRKAQAKNEFIEKEIGTNTIFLYSRP